MVSAYIRQLERDTASARAGPSDLQSRFLTWFDGLPEFVRERAWSMSEMEKELATQGKYISPILMTLGWRRMRRWSSRGQYHRYWIPPFKSAPGSARGGEPS